MQIKQAGGSLSSSLGHGCKRGIRRERWSYGWRRRFIAEAFRGRCWRVCWRGDNGGRNKNISRVKFQHGSVPVQAAGDDEFIELRARKVSAPVILGRDALPAVFLGQVGEIDPVIGRNGFRISATLVVCLGVQVIAGV